MGLEEITTESIANYSAALEEAFETLEYYRNEELGANCNQAIMLISDGEFALSMRYSPLEKQLKFL